MVKKKDLWREFTIQDFKGQASPLTKKFRKIRLDTLGRETVLTRLVKFSPRIGVFTWKTVSTSNPGYSYEMKMKIVDLRKWVGDTEGFTKEDLNQVLSVADIKLQCSCPAFHWQGMRYQLSSLESALTPTDIPDPVWSKRHDGKNALCKHLYGLLQNFNSYKGKIHKLIKTHL